MDRTLTPNHHAHFPGFAGATGLLAALSMAWGRDGDAHLAAELTGLGATDDLVDVGCGPGAAIRHVGGRARSVVGVDPAPVMLRVARLLARRVRFVEGSAESLPLPDASASVLWSIACVHHWDDVAGGIEEARRVLRAGGRFLAVEKHVEAGGRGLAGHGWTRDQADAFAAACADHGLADVAVSEHDLGRRRVVAVLATRPAG